jgi:NTP pyrophosphatase (non-canonical NTP hydrolase)
MKLNEKQTQVIAPMEQVIAVEWQNNVTPTSEQLLTSPVVMVRGKMISYAQFVSQLFKLMPTHADSMMHAAVGVAGEAGELADAIKKAWVYGKPLDRDNVIEELGDLRFYMQALQLLLGITDAEVIGHNSAKLEARYPDGVYSNQAAIARADKEQA